MPADYSYHPSVPQAPIPTEYRVIPIHLLDEGEQRKVKLAMANHPAGRGVFATNGAMHEESRGGDYWCLAEGTLHDVMVSAEKSADVTRRPQTVHMHASDEECGDHEHIEVTFSEPRSTAVGGRQHG